MELPIALASTRRVTSFDQFRALRRAGATVMLWFGFDTLMQRGEIVQQFDNDWLTEIHLNLLKEARPELNSGVFECGLYFANLPSKARDAVECLGNELAPDQSLILAPRYREDCYTSPAQLAWASGALLMT